METYETWPGRIDSLPTRATLYPELAFEKVGSGKVRELFKTESGLLMIATDRLSAFDVIMNEGIPGKGIILNQMSRYWFWLIEQAGLIPHHLLPDQDARLSALLQAPDLERRAMLVQAVRPLPIEAVVRGFLAGSGWKVYSETGNLFDQEVPSGLRESEALPEPVFTPTTKAASGHDMPMTHAQGREILGAEQFEAIREISLELYRLGRDHAARAGMLLADTKFEFGLDGQDRLVLIDEVLTPDSSRYWPAEGYQPGGPQPSFDKQFVRDYLETCDWDKAPPPPELPAKVIAGTLERYREAYHRLTANP